MSLFRRRLVVQVDTCSGVCRLLVVQFDTCSDVVPSSVGGPTHSHAYKVDTCSDVILSLVGGPG